MQVLSSFVKRRISHTIDAMLFVCGLLLLSTLLEIISL